MSSKESTSVESSTSNISITNTNSVDLAPVPDATPKKTISHAGGFIAGGLAACGAVTVTNPIELIKTRYELN